MTSLYLLKRPTNSCLFSLPIIFRTELSEREAALHLYSRFCSPSPSGLCSVDYSCWNVNSCPSFPLKPSVSWVLQRWGDLALIVSPYHPPPTCIGPLYETSPWFCRWLPRPLCSLPRSHPFSSLNHQLFLWVEAPLLQSSHIFPKASGYHHLDVLLIKLKLLFDILILLSLLVHESICCPPS